MRTTKHIEDVPLGDYDAVLACIPTNRRRRCSAYCIDNARACSSKSRCGERDEEILDLEARARAKGVVVYTAYNHRFEPHFVRMRDLVASAKWRHLFLPHVLRNGTAGWCANQRGGRRCRRLARPRLDLLDTCGSGSAISLRRYDATGIDRACAGVVEVRPTRPICDDDARM